MRKLIFCFSLVTIFYGLYAQDIIITFQPKDTGLQIDSIRVYNQKTGKGITLFGNESLILMQTTNSNVISLLNEDSNLYPNPCYGDAKISFSTYIKQEVIIKVNNISGQVIGYANQELSPGLHTFKLTFPIHGIYVVSVLKDKGSHSVKVLCARAEKQKCFVKYFGSESPNYLKSAEVEKALIFTPGDILNYTAFSGKNKTVLTDSPTTSKIYSVEFFECIDPDNRGYSVVRIGNQVWMAENLAYLTAVSPAKEGSYSTPFYYVYDYNGTSVSAAKIRTRYGSWGVLYNWSAALAGTSSSSSNPSGIRGICPQGWHLPSDAEWGVLIDNLISAGYNSGGAFDTNSITKALSSHKNWLVFCTDTTESICSENATNNRSGFSGLPGGYRDSRYFNSPNLGSFYEKYYNACWWSSTMVGNSSAKSRQLNITSPNIYASTHPVYSGLNVRCVKDDVSGPVNKPPIMPHDPKPENDTTQVSLTPMLSWECSDLDSDSLTYDIYLSVDSQFYGGLKSSQLIANYKINSELNSGTTYYWQVIAKDNDGSQTRSPIWRFIPSYPGLKTGTFIDSRDKRRYSWVLIGTQTWMSENLAYLPSVSPPSKEDSVKSYYYVSNYQDTIVEEAKNRLYSYGVLYNFPAALTACPEGWHLPSDAEWKKLEMHLGMTQDQADALGARGTDQDIQMKTPSGWQYDKNGINSSGFSGLPGGERTRNLNMMGVFSGNGSMGSWWSSSENSSSNVWCRTLKSSLSYPIGVDRNYKNKTIGISVRCIKD